MVLEHGRMPDVKLDSRWMRLAEGHQTPAVECEQESRRLCGHSRLLGLDILKLGEMMA